MAGWKGYYEPRSRAYHRGFATFAPTLGRAGCDLLAARNSLIFAWKNLRGWRLAAHLAWLPMRVLHALTTPRGTFTRALIAAASRLGEVVAARRVQFSTLGRGDWSTRQEAFFRRFPW
jgi:hypothetical protein